MKILLLEKGFHHKNHHALKNYKNIQLTTIYDENQLNNVNLSDFDIVYSPASLINVSLYPNTKFIFGPHFFVYPDMEQLKLMNSDHSIYIQPSQWVIDWYLSKNVINKMAPMPFGVDTERFNQVKPIEQRNKVLLYKKCRKPEDIESVIQILSTSTSLAI